MAQTIQSLFPFTTNKRKDFLVYPCYVDFAAPVIGGKYIFSEATTPAKVFGKLQQGQTGVIAGVNISANTTPDNFTSGVENPLLLQILNSGNETPVNLAPFPFSQLSDTQGFQEEWEITAATMQQQDFFKLAITGEVNQLTGMTNNELILRVTFNFIKVASEKIEGGKNG